MREGKTIIGSGQLGNNQAANTNLAIIDASNIGPGRYRIWGQGRHSLADGLKFTSPFTLILPGGAGDTVNFGPFTVDITTSTTGLIIALNNATGAGDTASAVIYAERLGKD